MTRSTPAALLAVLVALVPAMPLARAQDEDRIRSLIADLGADDYATRVEAEKALEAAGEAARPLLEEAAESPDLEVRQRALRLLARFQFLFLRGGEMAKWDQGLVDQLLSADPGVRARAATDLSGRVVSGRLPRAVAGEALAVLKRVAAEGELDSRGGRGNALLLLGDVDAVLEWSRPWATRGRWMSRFRQAGDRYLGSLDSLAEAMARAEGLERTTVAWFALAVATADERASEEVPEATRARLLDLAARIDPAGGVEAEFVRGGLEVRFGNLEGLARILVEAPGSEPWLARILSPHREPAARRRLIVEATGIAGFDEAAIGRLAAATIGWYAEDPPEAFAASVAHSHPRVREFAAMAIGFHGTKGRTVDLRKLAEDPVCEVRISAAWALVQVGEREAGLEVLVRAVESESAEEVRDAIWALVSVRAEGLADRALALLDDPRPDVRAAAVMALAGSDDHLARIAALVGDREACRFYASPHAALATGTVGGAARSHLERRLGPGIPDEPAAAGEEVRRRIEARSRR